MGIIGKIFGASKLQDEFKKAISLKCKICVFKSDVSCYNNNISISKREIISSLFIDFKNGVVHVSSDVIDEIPCKQDFYKIIRIDNNIEKISIHLSNIMTPSVFESTLHVHRNYLILEGNLSNWSCKINNCDTDLIFD